jgi:hypothetical protein
MEYSLTEKQLDRLMKPYWDDKFNGAEIGEIENYANDEDWYGLKKDDFLIVGYPSLDDGSWWFSNGPYFEGGWSMFGIEISEFNRAMRRYIEDRFGPFKPFSIS